MIKRLLVRITGEAIMAKWRVQMAIDWWWRIKRERAVMSIAWHMPRWIAYWCYVRVAVEGTDANPADQTVVEPMKRWEVSR